MLELPVVLGLVVVAFRLGNEAVVTERPLLETRDPHPNSYRNPPERSARRAAGANATLVPRRLARHFEWAVFRNALELARCRTRGIGSAD